MARFQDFPAASQELLRELHSIVSNGEKDPMQRDEDCRRVREILSSGAEGVYPDVCFEFGQSLLCFSLHYDFGHRPQMLHTVIQAAIASDRIILKDLVNAPTNEIDFEHILEVLESLMTIDGDPYIEEKTVLLKQAGADLTCKAYPS